MTKMAKYTCIVFLTTLISVMTFRIPHRIIRKSSVHLLPEIHDMLTHSGKLLETLKDVQLHSFMPSAILMADEAASIYTKVDKTGVIGFLAGNIEICIDFGRTLLQQIGVQNAYGLSIVLFTILGK